MSEIRGDRDVSELEAAERAGETCTVCRQPLPRDPDDQVMPDGTVMCGECYRMREFDQTLWEAGMDA